MIFRKKKKMPELFARELRKRDREIAELNRKNELLLKTALRQSAQANEWRDYAQKLEKLNKDPKEEVKKAKRKH